MTSWLLLKTRLRHEIDVATEIDTAMETDWTCVPLIATAKPIARRKFTIRWQPALPGCILVPFENSGPWDGCQYARSYARNAAGWPWIVPAIGLSTFMECLSALNSELLRGIEEEEARLAAKALAKAKAEAVGKKKHKYVTATPQDLLAYARNYLGVDLAIDTALTY
jgi:hypothetical protein